MTKLFTPRMGLVKPQPATGEPVLVEDLNSNADTLDKWAGAVLVNDGVTPSTAELFDGAIVKEKTSGKVWVAQKNVGGTFDKKWIRYPWSTTGYTTSFSTGEGWGSYGFLSYGGASVAGAGTGPVNSSASDFIGSKLILPVTGIYSLIGVAKWAAANVGVRGINFNFNESVAGEDINTGTIIQAVQSGNTQARAVCTEQLPAGTSVSLNAFQNSGGFLSVTFVVFATLLEVTG